MTNSGAGATVSPEQSIERYRRTHVTAQLLPEFLSICVRLLVELLRGLYKPLEPIAVNLTERNVAGEGRDVELAVGGDELKILGGRFA